MLTTIALVTAGGLLLLAAAIALVDPRGTRAAARRRRHRDARRRSSRSSQGAVSITERVPDDETDERTEIGRVGHALNTLLDHVDESLDARQRNEERMRRFVADASHELRTPAGLDPRLLRAVAASAAQSHDAADARDDRVLARAHPGPVDPHDRRSSRTCCCSRASTRGRSSSTARSTCRASRSRRSATPRPAGPDHSWELDLGEEPVVDRRRRRPPAPGRRATCWRTPARTPRRERT